jgi:hypothetical protein
MRLRDRRVLWSGVLFGCVWWRSPELKLGYRVLIVLWSCRGLRDRALMCDKDGASVFGALPHWENVVSSSTTVYAINAQGHIQATI